MLNVTLKLATTKKFNKLIKPATGGNVYFDFFKAINEEKRNQKKLYVLLRSKCLPILGEEKNGITLPRGRNVSLFENRKKC